ncbi:MAG: type II secretion system F family protein [Gaiellaceae bacterium]
MSVILVAGLALLGLAISLLARAVVLPRARSASMLRTIANYGFASGNPSAVDAEAPFSGLADRVGRLASRRLGPMTNLRGRLIAAGMYETTVFRFVGYQVILAVALPLIWIFLSGLAGLGGLAVVLGFIWAAVIGLFAPVYYLSRRGRMRQGAIDRELPELIDLLVVTIEAGVGFAGALRVAAERLEGPLSEELRLTMQEQNMGLTAMEALHNLGERAPTPGVRIFTRAVMQGETLGVSVGAIMRNVALEMRKRRKALAEERAQKAPLKMLFPLIFLIFPAMFIVLLVPAIIAFMRALS